ncbi:protein-arginine deiminase type-3-like [Erythrolamprus reginae]|uniref:protein-arginine deiminase type-3-like n=1 Tax=Erythrolamprus reginae TaxID=121349 RepID=UPI00396CFCD9
MFIPEPANPPGRQKKKYPSMANRKCVQLSTEKVTSTFYILGTELCLDIHGAAPKGATSFEIWATPGLNIYKIEGDVTKSKVCCHDSKWLLDQTIKFRATMDAPSDHVNDEKIRVSYYDDISNIPIAKAVLHITCIEMSLDADINRSGTVTKGGKQKGQWKWGPDGKGAILLVNCDRDKPSAKEEDNKDTKLTSMQDLEDMSRMILTTKGPKEVFAKYQLILHLSKADSDKVGVFYAKNKKRYYKHVLGSGKISYHVKWNPDQVESVFYVEGLKFPDADFSGLVPFHASLLEPAKKGVPETSILTDSLIFRVAPWIMTPNILQPVSVYVCSVRDNDDFVENIRKLAKKAGCNFIICTEDENRYDRWIQDEMEIGYIQAPHKTFPVVFDSPRNRGLKDFPFKKILGPDFGYVKRESSSDEHPSGSSLDSFGNLEVSPPVNVKGKEYPLGRILIGSRFPRFIPMSKLVKDFLYAQVVQSPIELFTDWLNVGHVDEFLTFVPAPDQKGFRLLLASPRACFKLLEEKEKEGHGKAKMPEGIDFQEGGPQPRPISEIIADRFLRDWNTHCQECIDDNRNTLKEELGLAEEDIIEIPQLFRPNLNYRMFPHFKVIKASADAYFPDMVNMIVLGKHLGIPKPFGPVIDGQCCLEKEVRRLLEPLGLSCNFIDDYGTYFIAHGDVHCGTNVRRKPFSFKWWNMKP